MVNFTQIFDIKSIDDFQLGHLAWVLNSPSYDDVFKPYLQKRRDDLAAMMLDRSQDRKDIYPDDFLCGGIVMIDGLLALFTQLIDETSMEQIHRSQITKTNNEQYDEARKSGEVHPMSIAVLEDDGYDPAEDY